MHVLVTAGPTREYWDDIRYLSNRSSGKMGYAIAIAAKTLGHRVTLISGPTSLPVPQGIRFQSVTSAREMEKAVGRVFPSCDLVIMAAAVCDFRPKVRFQGKLKKAGKNSLKLELVRNPDILKGLGARKGKRRLIGFALEASQGRENAKKKLREKNLDFVVLNGPGNLENERASAVVLGADNSQRVWKNLSKLELAKRLVKLGTG